MQLVVIYSSSFVELNFEPAFYTGHFNISKVGDTYISFRGWSKGVAFVNDVNIGRYWPVNFSFSF